MLLQGPESLIFPWVLDTEQNYNRLIDAEKGLVVIMGGGGGLEWVSRKGAGDKGAQNFSVIM